MDEDPKPYTLAHAVLVGVWLPTLFVVWVLSLVKARRRGDPARTAFVFYKVAIPVILLFLIFWIAADGISYSLSVYFQGDSRSRTPLSAEALRRLRLASYVVFNIGQMLHDMASALVFITLVELGTGFLLAATGKRSVMRQVFRYIAIGLSVVLSVLTVAACGVISKLSADNLDPNVRLTSRDFYSRVSTYQKLQLAHDALHWTVLLPTVALGGIAVHKYRSQPLLRSSAIIYLVAATMNFVRFTYILATTVEWNNPDGRSVVIPVYAPVLSAIFSTWFLGVVLVLIFVIGIRKQKGLWSTAQPFHGGAAPAPFATSVFGSAPTAAYQPPPMGYQAPGYQGGPGAYPAPMGYQAPIGYQAPPAGWQPRPAQAASTEPVPTQSAPTPASEQK